MNKSLLNYYTPVFQAEWIEKAGFGGNRADFQLN